MRIKVIRNTVLISSICVLSYGISRGEVGTALKKAINICLECIGIG